MKTKLFLFFIILSTLPLILKSQKYYPFPDSNAVWQVSEWCSDPPNCGDWVAYYYYYGKDTIINGYDYKEILRTDLQWTSGTCQCLNPQPYYGFLRQDTVNKKVYYRFFNAYNQQDTLFYDFNLNIGDTLKGYFSGFQILTVVLIDSILIGNNYRKRINFDTTNYPPGSCNVSIIEGIGGTNGLLEGVTLNPSFMPFGYNLNCFSVNGITLYNSLCPKYAIPCELITITIQIVKENNIKIYPNPVSDYLTVSTRECALPLKVEVYSISGAKLDEKAICIDKTQINLSSYKKGTYIIRIQNKHNNIIKTEKIILR
ncbi:MAG: T9SS type A sorting domain-containing protein [Bacteroidales bacterium]|nr:T9SS type A sorting domain-containing protein [Bacteroidales bacterium]